jgi:hypothetical protein
VFGQDKKGADGVDGGASPPLDDKKISLMAKKKTKTRKVKNGMIPPEYGLKPRNDDFGKDDRIDIVSVKISVVNKTGRKVDGLRVVCEFFGRNAGVRKKNIGPIGAEEALVRFNEKGKFDVEFKKYTLFDRTEDEFEFGRRSGPNQSLPVYQVAPRGIMFYGYKVTLYHGDRVLKEAHWPSSVIKCDMDDRLLEWDVPKPTGLNIGGGKLDEFVSLSKNPPGSLGKDGERKKKEAPKGKVVPVKAPQAPKAKAPQAPKVKVPTGGDKFDFENFFKKKSKKTENGGSVDAL